MGRRKRTDDTGLCKRKSRGNFFRIKRITSNKQSKDEIKKIIMDLDDQENEKVSPTIIFKEQKTDCSHESNRKTYDSNKKKYV